MTAPIILSVGRDVRRSPLPGHTSAADANGSAGRKGDAAVAALRERVITQPRFGRRCWYCHAAFGTGTDFEIHHLDADHMNESPDNLVPICMLCHLPWHLDLVLRKWPSDPGSIIFAPELEQAELNALLYAVFYHSESTINPFPDRDAKVAEDTRTAAAVYERFQRRRRDVEEVNGQLVRPGLASVHGIVRLLQSLNEAQYEARAEMLAGCRYLPPMAGMLSQAQLWRQNGAGFSKLDIASWPSVAGVAA